MITKNFKNTFSYITALAIGLFIAGCDQEENTDFSTFIPSAPTLTVTSSVNSARLIEDNSVYTFTATLSETQLVDVKLYVTQIDGDATLGLDYTVDGVLTIATGTLSASGKITILADDLVEETESVKIQIGGNKTANADLNSETMLFTILNYEEGDLAIDMSWDMAETTTDNSGVAIDPTDFADLRLLISSNPDNSGDIGEADGASFETLVLSSSTPNGEYYVVADFWSANSNIVRDINLNLNFNQAGVINDQHHNYASAINNDQVCAANYYVMAKITKSGDTFTIEDVRVNNMDSFAIDWNGNDAKGFYAPEGWPSHVVTGIDCTGGRVISGLNAEWMVEVWGETIEEEGVVYFTVDVDGIVTIEEQYIFTTLYSGTLYPYTVSGTGILDEGAGTLNIQYHLFQDGWSVDGYWFGAGGLSDPYFEARLTVD